MTLAEFHMSQFNEMQSKQTSSKSTALSHEPTWARIEGFTGDPVVIERLKEMGLHQGLEVHSVEQAPFGGPMLFRFGNTVLALRQEEAACTLIQK